MFCRRSFWRRPSIEMPVIKDIDSEEESAMDLLRGLNRLRKEGTFCDITLRVDAKTIQAHKNVISVRSPYFMAMFSGHFSESNQQEISIKDIDADSLELLIDYMYTGYLQIDADNVKNLIATSSFLQIAKAEELCCKFIRRILNAKNCIEYLAIAASNSIPLLLNDSIETVAFNFEYVFSQNEFFEIEHEEMKQLTRKLKKLSYPEDMIFSFVIRWIRHSYEIRKNFIGDLLQELDPLLVSPSVMHSKEIVNSQQNCIANNTSFTTWATRANASCTSDEPGDRILVSRRLGTFSPLRIKIFSQAKHRQIERLRCKITDGSYVCNGYYVYHQGGWKSEGQLLTETYVYHPIRSRWSSFVPLQEARAYHRSCVLNGRIFSVGGSNGVKALSSVEFTDIYTGQREFIEPLPRAKERPGLGLLENAIYVVGGSDRGTSYKCIHRYDERESVWQELAPSPYRAGASSCAVIGESIYTTHPDTLQRYDIRANDWSMISAEYERYPPEVFAINNTLFGLFSDHVARFIPEGGKWENQRTLKCNLPYLQVSTNLLFPNVNEEEIRDKVFEGFPPTFDLSENDYIDEYGDGDGDDNDDVDNDIDNDNDNDDDDVVERSNSDNEDEFVRFRRS